MSIRGRDAVLCALLLVLNFLGVGCAGLTTANQSAPSGLPTIVAQPTNQTVTVGQAATFSVTASGTAPLSYQWQKNGANISGATSSSYTTPATTTADSGSIFQVVVSNSAGSITSSSATLTVNLAAVAPTITTQPTNQTVTVGQAATFSVAASGTAPLSYQWQKNGANISGATSSSYTTPATTTADSGSIFQVVVSNSAGSITSSSATLTVNLAAVAPTITTQPTNQTVTVGQAATFSVAASGTAPLSYQWQKNGANISGATSSSYTTPATTTADSGSIFQVVVSNSAGSITSSSATLTVNLAAVAPTITTQPTNQTVTVGQAATFSVAASGTAPLSYQWQKNGANISGATSSSYTTPATTTTDSGSIFQVVVSNSAGSITSSSATLTVNLDTTPPTVSITSPTSGATVSGTITVTALASDSVGVISVQLQVDGTNVGAVDTTSPYNFSLNTATLTNGSHSLIALATDTAGNQATSAQVSIVVSNQSGNSQPTYANNGAGCSIDTVETVTTQTCPLPNATGAGNLLVVWLRYHTPAQSPTFSDNVGGNTYSLATSVTDSTNSTVAALYYVANVKAGVNQVTVSLASTTLVQMQPYEFYNVATTSPLDQVAGQASSGTSISSGALAGLGSSGDLVIHFGTGDNTQGITSCTAGSEANITWGLRETMIGNNYPSCLQYGVYNSTASFSPTFTVSTGISYISIAAAFKAASAGTAPPSGIRVAYVQHDSNQSEQATSTTLEYPISGNAFAVFGTSGCAGTSNTDCAYATGASDGTNIYTQVGSTVISNYGADEGNSAGTVFYAKNVTPSTYITTWALHTRSSGGIGTSFMLFDVTGASTSPLDTGYGNTGLASATFDQAGGGGNGGTVPGGTSVTVYTATPSTQNEVVLATVGAANDTWIGITSPAGAQFLSVATGLGSTTGGSDYNEGWAIFYNGSSTAAQTWTWTHDLSTSGLPGAGSGMAMGIAFLPQ